jgi:hypothetical protein
MKFNGSAKQNKWAESILQNANLTEEQVDNLLRWAGPTMHAQGIMDVTIVIENRDNLAAYADSLGSFYKLSKEEKHAVAEDAAGMIRDIAKGHIG